MLFSLGLAASCVNALWSWAPGQGPYRPLGWVPGWCQCRTAWSQAAVLGDIPAQNVPDGATSPHAVPWDSEPVSQELTQCFKPAPARAAGTWGPGQAACHGPALQALCWEGLCHQIPEQWIQ